MKTMMSGIKKIFKPDLAISGIIELTDIELSYLSKIGTLERPAGIIDNASNSVLVRNRASRLQLDEWGISIPNTTRLWQSGVLDKLKKDIFGLRDGDGFNREYQLLIPKVGLVFLRERFVRIMFQGKVSRVFEQLDCRLIKEKEV